MFVQVVRGVVRDPELTFARLDLWLQQLAPGTRGWLGTTAGVTRNHELISFVRFASAADARHSSDRVEQAQWWAESATVFAGDVSFDNYDGVTLFGDGGSEDAALVEVLVGRVPRRRGAEVTSQLVERVSALSPRVIGGLVGLHDNGDFTQAVYFCHAEDEPLDAGTLLDASPRGTQLRALRLEHLWFGSPTGAVRRCPGPQTPRGTGLQLRDLAPADDDVSASAVLALQRAAYRLEAELIGDDRIPALHEDLEDLRAAGLTWRGAFEQGALVGAVAWTETSTELELHRLVVDPSALHRGIGRTLVEAALRRAGQRRTVVATGRANLPAQQLYAGLGFVHRMDVEVRPGLWVSELVRPGSAGDHRRLT
ncbi:GNAT family N-acetyltransferase [uncultured Friedmanniella sp.]|uniref:GNAT family N-acetyltransferase n=1 Tax=uncultured Friedmanniella sp. TaxID=335381 RepID=UPI0035C95264